jgi:hypothetical protein
VISSVRMPAFVAIEPYMECVAYIHTNVYRYGGVEAATFCALMTLYDALQHEASVDVYTVSKLYHMKRPHVFPNEVGWITVCICSRHLQLI